MTLEEQILQEKKDLKPDFKSIAEAKYPTPYICGGDVDITPAYRDGFQDGCEYVWKIALERIKEEVEKAWRASLEGQQYSEYLKENGL